MEETKKLPGVERALVKPEKVRDYLLSAEHPVGRFKAAYFERLGYSRQEWHRFEQDILQMARTGAVAERPATRYGRKYEVSGILRGPSGREASVKTIWIVKVGEDFPTLVTVYPGDER